MQHNAIERLLRTDLLAGVPENLLRALDPPPQLISIRTGDTLIEQGRQGDAFYLLVHGRLRAFVAGKDGMSRRVGDVLPGEGVGEMSLLTNDLTAATVRATHDCELVRFSRESYKQLMESSPAAALQVARMVIKRLRKGLSEQRRTLPYRVIAILPRDDRIDVIRFAEMLRGQLANFAPAIICAAREATAHESEGEVALYLADHESTEWTQFCLRQADLVLVVSAVNGDSGLNEAEKTLLARMDPDLAPRCDLVLLHPEQWRLPCDTRRWLQARTPREHHHVRAWLDDDFARLARLLTGNAVNVVLGGGGARGFAQIGVLKALREAGVPIDRICGTSMGSTIGGVYAVGHSLDDVARISHEIWVKGRPLSDYTFPALAIIRGRRLHNMIKNALRGWDVEDTPIPFFCVSVNLTTADLVLHDRGSLWEGVRASISIPGIGPPLFRNGHMLVDGGILNNLPVDLARERHEGSLIAIDVSRQSAMQVPEDIDQVPSGWRVLWRRLNPFRQSLDVPRIFEILVRAATLSSNRLSKRAKEMADVLFVPPIEQFAIFGFDAMPEIVEIGYAYAVERLRGDLDDRIARHIDPAWRSAATIPTGEGHLPAGIGEDMRDPA